MVEKQYFHGKVAAGVLPMAKDTCRFLLMRRSKEVLEPGTYGTIGGRMESWEKLPRETAYREFLEETEYEGHLKMIRALKWDSPDGKFRYHNFLGIVDREFVPVLGWENDEYKWVDLNELRGQRKMHFGLRALLNESKDLINKHYSACTRRK
jgi:8-oxo-dGTP pyrophosphatase MutT (NUDIX family)